MRSLCLALPVFLIAAACPCGDRPDAVRPAQTVVATVARVVDLHPRAALSLTPAGYRLVQGTLDVTLPSSARAAAHLGVVPSAFWVELAPLGLRDRPGEVVSGAVVYRDVDRETDLVWLGQPGAAEELRVLNGPSAPTTARYRLARGADVGDVRVKGDVVEVADRDGVVRLASAPLYAVDARGVRRSVHADVVTTSEGLVLETSLDARGLSYPIVVDPAWSTVSPMATARFDHTATLLKGELVLVSGGVDAASAPLSSAELFDLSAKTWTAAPAMSVKRRGHTATLLSTGKVLVVGGTADSSNSHSTAQLFDVATKTWTASPSMKEVRTNHTATLLPGDKVLVVGGTDFSPGQEWASAELYDGATNTWSPAGTMAIGRQEHAATLLATGQVLVTGGRRGGGVYHSTAELFDPATGTWSSAGAMLRARGAHGSTLLSSGKVLITGGRAVESMGGSQTYSQAELYDPTLKTWKGTSAPMGSWHSGHTAAALPLDRVLIVGGSGNLGTVPSVELYSLTSDRFAPFAPLATARVDHATVQLPNLELLVTGGQGTAALASVELLKLGAPGDVCKDGLAECASGYCVDGVCCDTACNGQCEACDVPATKGVCSPVVGAPHAKRTACSDGAGITCQAKHCDGADRTTCAGFADVTTTCSPAGCADGAAKVAARCDGKGACASVTSVACAPYACGLVGCKTTCTSDADCAGSNLCDTNIGRCVVADSTCTIDGLSSQPLDRAKPAKSCAPYRCDEQGGKCFDRCTTSDVCAPGTICDVASGTCGAAAAAEDDGGCSFVTPRRTLGGGLALLGVLLVVSRRRNRARGA